MAGGLTILGLFTAGVVVRAAFTPVRPVGRGEPARTAVTSPRPRVPVGDPARHAADALADPIGSWEQGRLAGGKVRAASLDTILDRMYLGGLGDPRVVVSRPNLKVVRVHGCRTCAASPQGGARAAFCQFERGFLEGAIRRMTGADTAATETSCRGRGDAWCEFEVRYA